MDVSDQCKTYRKSQELPLGTFAFRILLKRRGLSLSEFGVRMSQLSPGLLMSVHRTISDVRSRVSAAAISLFWSAGRQPNAHRIFRVKRPMPRIGGFQSFHTARRTIRGFEAMLWLRKGFGFAGAWTVCEQNQLLSVCFGLLKVNEA